jgi:membrane peptidoglycan carboxypeptidase
VRSGAAWALATRRRSIWLGLGVVAALAGTLVVAVWNASPDAAGLGARVQLRLSAEGGKLVELKDISPMLLEAVVATEDERFYRHNGIDLLGVLRALPYDVSHLSYAQGASTITEQVAKVLYLKGNDHSLWLKLEDAAVAVKLERRYSKAQILAAYLNSVYFGEGAYGIRAASERYFGVVPRDLTAAEASLLAGLIQAPSAYDPFRSPEAARSRQISVLRALVGNGVISVEQASALLARPLELRGHRALPPVRGVDLSPGPAFVWWQLAAGVTVSLLAATALAASRVANLGRMRFALAIRAVLIVLCVSGLVVVVRSFRTM